MDLKNPTRTEALLANIAGHTDVPVPDMKNATRSERLLKEILDNGGGGGGDVTKEYVDTAISNAVADIDDDISALSDTVADKVDKVNGKGLSTNDYTDADKALVQDSPITTTSTASPISTSAGKLNALAIYGKSEVVDGSIKSAGEGWSTVDLSQLEWIYLSAYTVFGAVIPGMKIATTGQERIEGIISSRYPVTTNYISTAQMDNKSMMKDINSSYLYIKDTDYTDAIAFKNSLNGIFLAYDLADPTQGNCIAIKTDDGTGINGTMATFTTGTPLRGIPNSDIRDVMTWDGSAGTVTKNCGEVDLGTLEWRYDDIFYSVSINNKVKITPNDQIANLLIDKYTPVSRNTVVSGTIDKVIAINQGGTLQIRDTTYTNIIDFKTAMNGVKLVYELATPTTEQLTATENASIAGLRTFEPQTSITINDNPEFEVEAYANTANGQVISDMQTIVSPLLTLSASGWTNNAQTVTYAHDIGKRNSIDVEPTSIKAWTAAGILATAETASTITFECDTTPTADLLFRVTSMEVR